MSDKNSNYLVAFVLMVMLVVTAFSLLKEPEEGFIPILFSSPLNLTKDKAVEAQIIFHIVNRDNKSDDPIKVIPSETIEDYYDISITLHGIHEIDEILSENNTISLPMRSFDASYIDHSKPSIETHITGWIDEQKQVHEWDVMSLINIQDISQQFKYHPLLWNYSLTWDILCSVNYSGLPDGVDVKVYPENHVFSGDSFRIVFENNRGENLYWGSDWQFKEWINGEWVTPNITRVWTALLHASRPFTKVTNGHKFPFEDGLYRISKRCWLTDDYDRDKKEWVDEFTATFYLLKTS